MSTKRSRDRVSLCSFTFSDGRQIQSASPAQPAEPPALLAKARRRSQPPLRSRAPYPTIPVSSSALWISRAQEPQSDTKRL